MWHTDRSHLSWGHRGQCLHRRSDTQPTPPAGRLPTVGKQNGDFNELCTPYKACSLCSAPSLVIFDMCEHTASIHRPPVISSLHFGPPRPAMAGGQNKSAERRRKRENGRRETMNPAWIHQGTTGSLPLFHPPPPHAFQPFFIYSASSDVGMRSKFEQRVDKNKT